jgi:hypothetical protein
MGHFKKMKRKTNILILTLVVLISCVEKKTDDSLLLRGVRWENSALDFVGFDSTLMHIPIKDFYPTTCTFKYSVKSDTLTIINKTVNAYNLIELKDSLSILKIDFLTKDSIKLRPLNSGARKLFKGFENLKFYNPETIDRFSYYIEKNSIYKAQTEKAIEDIKKGRYVVCLHNSWPFRQEKEFEKILKRYNVSYKDLGPPSDVLPVARNCYKETMDYYLTKKFRNGFVEKIMEEADSVMVINSPHRVFDYFELDIKPSVVVKTNKEPNFDIVCNYDIKYDSSHYGGWPVIELGFTIHKDSTISDFKVLDYVYHLKSNKKYKKELTKLAIEELKSKYPIWAPGKILGKEVMANHFISIGFVKKEKKANNVISPNCVKRPRNEKKTPHNTRLWDIGG